MGFTPYRTAGSPPVDSDDTYVETISLDVGIVEATVATLKGDKVRFVVNADHPPEGPWHPTFYGATLVKYVKHAKDVFGNSVKHAFESGFLWLGDQQLILPVRQIKEITYVVEKKLVTWHVHKFVHQP